MLEVDKNTFQTEVLEADGYVFVDFFGDGCVPCAALMPKVHEFADTYGDKLKFTILLTQQKHVVWQLVRRFLAFRLWLSTKMERK